MFIRKISRWNALDNKNTIDFSSLTSDRTVSPAVRARRESMPFEGVEIR